MTIGEAIYKRRKELGLTLEDVGEFVGVSKSTVKKWETGYISNMRRDKIALLAKVLRVSPASFIADENQEIAGLIPEENENTVDKETASAIGKTAFDYLEETLLKKYYSLDLHGREIVDAVLEIEYNRCISEEEEENLTIEIKYSLLPASAGVGAFLEEENIEIREFPDCPEARQADIVIPVDGNSMEPLYSDGDKLYVRLQPAVEVGEVGIFMKDGKGFVKEYAEDRLISINPDFEDIYPDEYDMIRCVGKVIGRV